MEKTIDTIIKLQEEYFKEKNKALGERDCQTLELLSLKLKLQENNIVKTFIDNYYKEVIDTLKKYQNKKIGEKTRDKIQEDIKTISPFFQYVYIHRGCYEWDSNDWTLTIDLKNKQYEHSRVKIKLFFRYLRETSYNTENSGTYTVTINDYKLEDWYYIDNIDTKAVEIIEEYKKLKQEIKNTKEELNNKMTAYREKYPFRLTTSSQEFKHIY